MSSSQKVSDRIRRYFHVKSRQLAAIAELSICEHSGLIGSHREQIQRVYLSEILPKRFEVGRGMVYGPFHRSHEADIVIWDAQNYSSLPISDHAFFFADSVRAVLECKSTWSSDEFQDVLTKCRAVRDIIVMGSQLNLADELEVLRHQVASIRENVEYEGMLKAPHQIGTAAVFLTGGQSLTADTLTDEIIQDIDDAWPDVLLLLQPGRVVIKNYRPSGAFGGQGWLEFYDLNEDALLVFTTSLLALITERSVQVEDPLYISNYVRDISAIAPTATVDFALTRPVAQRTPIWQ